MSASMDKMLDQTASTKTRQQVSGEFVHVANLTKVKCSDAYPLDPEVQFRLAINTPHELLEMFTEAADIKEGDLITLNGTEYPVRSCANWPASNSRFLRLLIEDLKA